ncbi:MAG: hypothetical protein GVY22_09240 [Gammaproteobacteria bacterium]|jgi:DNA-directed RNA polymerase subunit RPC12/RpoP|nr:hypothetical protein [Gammaproteobacteria bacterium]
MTDTPPLLTIRCVDCTATIQIDAHQHQTPTQVETHLARTAGWFRDKLLRYRCARCAAQSSALPEKYRRRARHHVFD